MHNINQSRGQRGITQNDCLGEWIKHASRREIKFRGLLYH
jgi:hypothetical protein